uniref:Uncharacterized protein n=1 Tax=Zonotrichia albicollis TaxID=44394 RepID=A0A8D2QDV9_ZONAL
PGGISAPGQAAAAWHPLPPDPWKMDTQVPKPSLICPGVSGLGRNLSFMWDNQDLARGLCLKPPLRNRRKGPQICPSGCAVYSQVFPQLGWWRRCWQGWGGRAASGCNPYQ